MDLNAHISSIDGFFDLNEAEKIRFFMFHLHTRGRTPFEQADVTALYKEAGLERPNIGPYIARMVQRRPAELLKSRHGYQLERRVADELAARYGRRATLVRLDAALHQIEGRLANSAEQTFFQETMVCLKHGAFRSAVVMAWNLAFSHLCEYVFSQRLTDFNAQLPRSFPRADISQVTKRDDFSELKESQVIQVCRSSNITTNSVDKILREKLARRNGAAHPSGVTISQLVAEETLVDLVENIVLKY